MASEKERTEFIPYYKHLLELLDANKEFMKTTIGIHWQMVLTAVGVGVGGVVAGPLGALVGVIAGKGFRTGKRIHILGCSDEYSSMIKVLRGLTEEQKQNLVNEVQDLVGSTAEEDITTFVGSQAQRGALLNCIRHFLKGIEGKYSEDMSQSYWPDYEESSAPSYQPTYSDPQPQEDSCSNYTNIFPCLNSTCTEKKSYWKKTGCDDFHEVVKTIIPSCSFLAPMG